MKNKKYNVEEEDGIKIARLFYRQIEIISAGVIKDENICENLKQKVFEESIKNFDDLNDDEQQCYIIAASCGWQASMTVLRTLLELQENNKEK